MWNVNHREFEQRTQGKIHHHAVVKLQNGETIEGYMQPFDDEKVYFTNLDGLSGGSAIITNIVSIEFPERRRTE
jgi:hypothetical protein